MKAGNYCISFAMQLASLIAWGRLTDQRRIWHNKFVYVDLPS